VIRGEPVVVRNRKRPIDLLFNLDHPEHPAAVAPDFDEDSDDDDEIEILPDETEASEDELQRRFESMAFVVASRKLEKMPHWVRVSDVFKTDADAPFLQAAGVENFS